MICDSASEDGLWRVSYLQGGSHLSEPVSSPLPWEQAWGDKAPGGWCQGRAPPLTPGPVCAGRRRNVNCLKNVVIWYEDHKHRCPYEPHLAELDPTFGLYTTAVWQCEAGHRYFQDLHSPLKPLSDSDPDSDQGGSLGPEPPVSGGSAAPRGGTLGSRPSWVSPASQTSQQLEGQ